MRTRLSFRGKVVTSVAAALAAVSLLVSGLAAPVALADGPGQNDPSWDFGRGGALGSESTLPCYLPAPDQTRQRMYSLQRPGCYPGHLQ